MLMERNSGNGIFHYRYQPGTALANRTFGTTNWSFEKELSNMARRDRTLISCQFRQEIVRFKYTVVTSMYNNH